jgi:hypothetical protein
MKVENLAHQRPVSAFARGGWYSDTSLFQGLVVHTVFEDESGMNAKEVARGKSKRAVMLFKNFFRPPSPPTQGGKEREE